MIKMQLALPKGGPADDRLAFPQAAALILALSLGCWVALGLGLALLI